MESQTSIKSLDSENQKSYEKVGQIHNAIKQNMPIKVIENLLQTEGDINYEIPKTNCRGPNLLFSSYSIKPTINGRHLHISPDILNLLLDFGIDFTKKNYFSAKTVVHEQIYYYCKKENLLKVQGPFKNEVIDLVLSAHVKFNVISNPCDENGISHFHVACMTNNTAVVEFFLKNGVDVDEAVNANSPIFPSYTPLHLVAKYACTDTIEILLKYKADMFLKNANGLTPMHLLVDICKLGYKGLASHKRTLSVLFNFKINEMDDDDVDIVEEYGLCDFHIACLVQDASLIENYLTKVTNVNRPVNFDSPVCPGYTALHFAARSNIETFKLLITNGVNIEAKNGNGETPLDLFLQKYSAAEMQSLLLLKEDWENIILSDNETNLIDVISSMETTDKFISFLNQIKSISTIHIPWDSPLWPGYTLLHLVVTFTEEANYYEHFYDKRYGLYDTTKLQECLKRGCEITVTDAKRSTPLHLAFYLEKRYIAEFLLNHHEEANNPIDRHNLSHFHIACAIGHQKAVEHFLSSGVEVNRQIHSYFSIGASYNICMNDCTHFFMCPGSTALHMNVANGNNEITEILLKYGADVNAKDVNGFTPVHRLFTRKGCDGYVSHLLSVKNLKNCVAKGGLSHLHIASYFGFENVVEKLLNSGVDVNCIVNYRGKCSKQYYNDLWDPYGDPEGSVNFLIDYVDFTPLHFAMLKNGLFSKTTLYLIDRGADIFKQTANGISYVRALSNHEDRDRNAISLCNNSAGIRKHFEKNFDFAKLHFACCAADDSLVKKLMSRGVDVNAKIHSDSPVFKGFTPLHITALVACSGNSNNERKMVNKLKKIVILLITNGADLTVMNENCDTPLHLLPLSESHSLVDFLLQHVLNYDVNPRNLQGISFFHFACATHNALVIDKFLKNGVDVNEPINYFSDIYPGATPLHLAIRINSSNDHLCKIGTISQLQVVDLLIQNGANLNAKDVFGEASLLDVIKLLKLRRIFIKKLISNGADVHTTNLKGDTPFELLLRQTDTTWDEIQFFLNSGCHFNVYHPITHEGYLALIISSNNYHYKDVGIRDEVLFNVIQHPRIINIDNLGCTVIHNVVSIGDRYITYYDQVIEKLMNQGCDIDHQNNEGKTALHVAVKFKNTTGILALLKNGADMDITDSKGKTFIAYLYDTAYRYHYHDTIMSAFVTNIRKLEYCGLPVSEQNKQFEIKILKEQALQNIELQLFYCSMRSAKNRKIGSTSLSIYEFLMNDDVDIVYINMTSEERREVDRFIENVCKDGYDEIGFLLKLKYRQTIERIKLIEAAMLSLNFLMKYEVPELCCRIILMFLKNEDLKCLIASVI